MQEIAGPSSFEYDRCGKDLARSVEDFNGSAVGIKPALRSPRTAFWYTTVSRGCTSVNTCTRSAVGRVFCFPTTLCGLKTERVT